MWGGSDFSTWFVRFEFVCFCVVAAFVCWGASPGGLVGCLCIAFIVDLWYVNSVGITCSFIFGLFYLVVV